MSKSKIQEICLFHRKQKSSLTTRRELLMYLIFYVCQRRNKQISCLPPLSNRLSWEDAGGVLWLPKNLLPHIKLFILRQGLRRGLQLGVLGGEGLVAQTGKAAEGNLVGGAVHHGAVRHLLLIFAALEAALHP